MVRVLRFLAAFVIVAAAFPMTVPPGAAQEPAAPATDGAFLYFTSPGLTKTAPAPGAPVQTRVYTPVVSGVTVVSNPATNYPMDWEAYKFEEDYTPTGDLVFNLYVTNTLAKATFHYVSWYVLKGTTILTQDARQNWFPAVTVDAGQYVLARGATTLAPNTVFKKGETLVVRLYVATEQAGAAAEPRIAFGSPTTPSSVYLPGFGTGAEAPRIRQQQFFVDDADAFTTTSPSATTAKTRTLTGTKLDAFTMTTVAKTKVPVEMTAASDASCQVHLTFPAAQSPAATPNRGVQCEILVNGAVKGSNSNQCAGSNCVVVATSINSNVGPAVHALRIGVPLKGVKIPAGAELSMRVGVLAPEVSGYVGIQLLYGANNRQTGIQFGANVVEPEPAELPGVLVVTTDLSEVSAAPGENATFQLGFQHNGTGTMTINLNVSSTAPAELSESSFHLGPDENRTVTLLVRVPSDATPGDRIEVVLEVTSEGKREADVPLAVLVADPGAPGGPSGEPDPSSGPNGTAQQGDAPEGKETPGPGLIGAVAAVAAIVAWGRVRRRAA